MLPRVTTLKAPLCILAPPRARCSRQHPNRHAGAGGMGRGAAVWRRDGGGREWRPSGNLLLPAQRDPTHSSQHPGPAAHAEVGKNFRKEKLLPLTDAWDFLLSVLKRRKKKSNQSKQFYLITYFHAKSVL